MFCLRDYEEYAKQHLDRKSWSFISQGSEREVTLRENVRSFSRYVLIPRMLRSQPHRDLSVTILGEKISMPIGLAPTGYQRLAHPDGEIAAAKAAAEAGTVYTLSTVATTSLEDVAKHHPKDKPLWMQVYILSDRSASKDMILRAKSNGYKALVFTVDTPVLGLQLRLRRCDFELPPHLSVPNIPMTTGQSTSVEDKKLSSNVDLFNHEINWEDLAWMKSVSKLPIVVKGILNAEDALQAVKYGASAVWISNHGGRQLDCVPAALNVLQEISSALAGSGCEVYMDGGIRWGSDVLKAVALGARAVFIGRPALYGLCHSGADGVRSVLEILRAELDRSMHLAGCSDIKDVGPDLVRKRLRSRI